MNFCQNKAGSIMFGGLIVLSALLVASGTEIANTTEIKLSYIRNLDSRITLSGFSSGGGLAQQLLVSHPSLFTGIAVFQQTFYRCGPPTGNVDHFDNACTKFVNDSIDVGPYDPKKSIAEIHDNFEKELIENPKNLQNKRLYVYVGRSNPVFTPEMMLRILDVFEPFIQNPNAIRTRVQNTGLAMPTYDYGVNCSESAGDTYYLANCNLNGPFEALNFLLGDRIKLPFHQGGVKPTFQLDSLKEFDQEEFFEGINGTHYMAPQGYIYIPKACEGTTKLPQKCLLHFYFHGCLSGISFNQGNHLLKSGFLELAELNNIVLVFPQAQKTDVNYLGCWDSFGMTGPLYGTQEGIQVRIMKRMIERVTGKDGAGGLVADRLGIDREDGDDVESSAQSPIPSMVYLPASMSMPFAPLVVQLVR